MTQRKSTGEITAEATAAGTRWANAFLTLYNSAQPASANTGVPTANKLATYSVGGLFTAASDGFDWDTAVAGAVARLGSQNVYGTGVKDGTAVSARLHLYADDLTATSTSAQRRDFSVGLTGSDIEMADTNIVTSTIYPLGTVTLTYTA
jgi:hypothetical protein